LQPKQRKEKEKKKEEKRGQGRKEDTSKIAKASLNKNKKRGGGGTKKEVTWACRMTKSKSQKDVGPTYKLCENENAHKPCKEKNTH
jgi:hypothetical protein